MKPRLKEKRDNRKLCQERDQTWTYLDATNVVILYHGEVCSQHQRQQLLDVKGSVCPSNTSGSRQMVRPGLLFVLDHIKCFKLADDEEATCQGQQIKRTR